MPIHTEIRGLKEMQRNLEKAAADLHGSPVVEAMRDSTLLVERDTKQNLVGYQSPSIGGVNTGRLRASITPQVTGNASIELRGVVGSNVTYAPFVEFNTRPHWPPFAALEVWAQRHHTTAFLVARAISRRGTIGKHYLQKAFDGNKGKIEARFIKAVAEIVSRANT